MWAEYRLFKSRLEANADRQAHMLQGATTPESPQGGTSFPGHARSPRKQEALLALAVTELPALAQDPFSGADAASSTGTLQNVNEKDTLYPAAIVSHRKLPLVLPTPQPEEFI